MIKKIENNEILFGKDETTTPRLKRVLSDDGNTGSVPAFTNGCGVRIALVSQVDVNGVCYCASLSYNVLSLLSHISVQNVTPGV